MEPGYVLEDECNNEAKRLRESGREFYDGKYKDHFNNLFNSIGKWFKAMGDDPVRSRSSRTSQYLTNYIAQQEIWRRLGSTHKGFIIRQRGESNIQERALAGHSKGFPAQDCRYGKDRRCIVSLIDELYRLATFPYHGSSIRMTLWTWSLKISRYPVAIYSPTSFLSKPTTFSSFLPMTASPMSTTILSRLR